LLSLLGVLACNDTIGPLDIASVTVTPASDTLGAGQTVLLRATATRISGATATGVLVTWTASDTVIAVVDTNGRVIARSPGTVTVTALVGAATGQSVILVADSAPAITGVSPSIGTVGTRITVHGRHFRPGATLRLDTLAADSVAASGDTAIIGLVPAGAATSGTAYTVAVKNLDGTLGEVGAGFRASKPILRSVNGVIHPAGLPGSQVILQGEAFGDFQGQGQVLFSNGADSTVAATIASPSDWSNTEIVTTVPPGAASGAVVVQTASGTGAGLPFVVTSTVAFDPSALAWTATTSLPVGLSGHAAVVVPLAGGDRVYVIGGADSTGAPRKDVFYSPLQSGGQLGDWTAAAPLPTATAFAAAAVATPTNSQLKVGAGVIYLLGGVTSAGAPVATVFRGLLGADGTITSWSGGSLPAPLHSASAVMIRGDLYVLGGSTSGDAPVATVYRARVDSLGLLGPWQTEPPLPFARSYAAAGQAGTTLYLLGGDSATVSADDSNYLTNGTKVSQIVYAAVDPSTGDLAGWTVNGGSLGYAASKHTAVLAGGRVLLTGGLYPGADTGASEERYATLNGDGSVGAFTNAAGTQTIGSAGGRRLFNHAAVTWVDAGGTAHVLILGGDDVNAPGKKRAEVWVY
jgi:hypothetical protein